MSIRISIITINYQNCNQIENTIVSVLSQSYSNIEYIIIDGSSNDGSVEIIKKYEEKLTYWVSEVDNGIYHAMNKGWKKASGDYCLFLNSGDYLYSNSVIEEVVRFCEKSEADIVFGNLLTFDEYKNSVLKFDQPISLYYFYYSFIPHPATFTKRIVLEKLNGFYEHYKVISDWAFFVNSYINNAKFENINLIITAYNTNGISSNGKISLQDKLKLFNNEFKFLNADFNNFERLRQFDTSIITRIARSISSIKIKYFGSLVIIFLSL